MRKNTKRTDIVIVIVLLLITAAAVLGIVMSHETGDDVKDIITVASMEDLSDKTIGVTTGSLWETFVKEHYPEVGLAYYNAMPDLSIALGSGKIDAFLLSEESADIMEAEYPWITHLPEAVGVFECGVVFPKTAEGEKLRGQMDEFLSKIKNSGELEEIISYWRNEESRTETVDFSVLTGENGTLRFVTSGGSVPDTYLVNGKLAGYDPDLAVRFCKEYGYDMTVTVSDLAGELSGIVSGLFDFMVDDTVITEERKESINFSIPYGSAPVFMMVRKSGEGCVEERPFSYYAENRKIGALTGGLYEVMIRERYPEADIMQFNNQPDMAVALSAGIIDAFTCPESTARDFIKEDPSLTYLNEVFMEIPYGFAFERSADKEHLRDSMNEFLAKLHGDGTYDELVSVWFGDDDSKKTVDTSGLTGENGTIRYITAPTMQPFSYIANGVNTGFEVDIVTRFCREYGYALNIDNAEFSSLIPGISSGMYDIASGTIMITAERAESVNFSDVYYTANAVAVVKRESQAVTEQKPGFFDEISESFTKNFIREERWKLIVEGIGTTCLITALSALFGTVLAFLICMFRRTGSRLANAVSNIYVKLLQGTPMVVLLMILYYVLLGRSGLEAVWVAVIGFSLNFSAYVSEIMRSGIDSIDGGQREAALALGYTENQAFFRFIFPQAAVRFLPVYNGEIVSLLKSTSIVGYIAIQDLTKMSDIIRSRTYEAFFPLIVTAVIYFILAWIISMLLKLVLKCIAPKKKKRK